MTPLSDKTASRPSKRFIRRIFIPGLIGCCVVGFLLFYFPLRPTGPGVSTDSINYLSTADSLIAGKGFINHHGDLYQLWPPFYPLLLAIPGFFLNIDPFATGWFLNSLAYALIGPLTAAVLSYRFRITRTAWLVIAMMFFLASPSLFRVSINISSDPIFIVLVLVFLLVEHDFLQKRTIQSASLFGLIAALVPLQRYVGIIVIATGAASIFYHMRKDLKNAFRFTMLFSLFSATPISIWLVRNYVNTQVLFGTHRNTNLFLYLAENISDSALKISRWFIPASILPPGSAQFFGIIGSLVILTFFFVMRSGRQAKVKTHILHHINFYLMIISFYTVIAVMSRPWEHSYVLDDRLWLPLLPLLFVLLVLIFESGFLMDRLPSTKTDVFIMVLFGVWLFFPMNSMLKTISQIRNENQVITYNLYNSPDLKNSSITKYLQEEDIPENMTIYSNFHGAVYFYTKRQAESPPYNYLPKSLYDDWPKPSPALLVWYEPNFRKDIYQPNELTEFARISPQYVSEEGGVYLIEAIQSNEDR